MPRVEIKANANKPELIVISSPLKLFHLFNTLFWLMSPLLMYFSPWKSWSYYSLISVSSLVIKFCWFYLGTLLPTVHLLPSLYLDHFRFFFALAYLTFLLLAVHFPAYSWWWYRVIFLNINLINLFFPTNTKLSWILIAFPANFLPLSSLIHSL